MIGSSFFCLERVRSEDSPRGTPHPKSPEGNESFTARPEWISQIAPTFGPSLSEKRTSDRIADHPVISREHLTEWLGVSEGHVNQMMRNLMITRSLVQRRAK